MKRTTIDYLVEWVNPHQKTFRVEMPFNTKTQSQEFIKECNKGDKHYGRKCTYQIIERTTTTTERVVE